MPMGGMMPRVPNQNFDRQKGFIWLPREAIILMDIKVDDVSVRTDVLSAEFTRCISPEASSFRITLLNADGRYNYTGREEVEFFADLGVPSEVITIDNSGGQAVTITEGTSTRR